jgi:hypothetical protein
MMRSPDRHGAEMKRIAFLAAAILSAASTAQSQDFHRNVYGMYAAPTLYGFAQGSDYQLGNSGAGLDLGGYYARAFTPNFSVRLEVRYGTRALDDVVPNPLFLGTYSVFRLSEKVLEVPLILNADRRIPISDHELRISVGGGVSTKFVLDQKLLDPAGEIDSQYLKAADSYRRVGLLVDGGATFAVDRRSAIFARLRLDVDIATAGEPADADVIRRFWETGFYAGFEYGF